MKFAHYELKEKHELENSITENFTEEETSLENEKIEILNSEIIDIQNQMVDLKDEYDEKLKTDIKSKEEEIKAKEEQIDENGGSGQSQSISMMNQFISELGTARTQNEDKLAELTSQRNLKDVEGSLLKVEANKSGQVHYLTPIKIGVGLQALQAIAQIDKGESSSLVVESYISATDRSKINVGDETKISIDGVNQTKYGLLKGVVKEISSGTISQESENGASLLYSVSVELKDTSLKSGKEEIKAKASMPVNVSIIYDNEDYL